MPTVSEKRRAFRALHESGCFVLPNPYDVGTARYLQHMGFKALATTSSGASWSMGVADNHAPLAATLAHIRAIVESVDVPVNADFLNGFSDDPAQMAENVELCIETGIAGLSIEDQAADRSLYSFDLAVERIRAARLAVDRARGDVLLVARTEVFGTAHEDPLGEATRRLTAFAAAGADCLYAPDVRGADDIVHLVRAIAPKPVNVLARNLGSLSVRDLEMLGVRRISVGGAMARVAWAGFINAATEIMESGTFDAFAKGASGKELNALFKQGPARRIEP